MSKFTYEDLMGAVSKLPPPMPEPCAFEIRASRYVEPGSLFVIDPNGWPESKRPLMVLGHPDEIERGDIGMLAAMAVGDFLRKKNRADIRVSVQAEEPATEPATGNTEGQPSNG